jgi:hypothetical protein
MRFCHIFDSVSQLTHHKLTSKYLGTTLAMNMIMKYLIISLLVLIITGCGKEPKKEQKQTICDDLSECRSHCYALASDLYHEKGMTYAQANYKCRQQPISPSDIDTWPKDI